VKAVEEHHLHTCIQSDRKRHRNTSQAHAGAEVLQATPRNIHMNMIIPAIILYCKKIRHVSHIISTVHFDNNSQFKKTNKCTILSSIIQYPLHKFRLQSVITTLQDTLTLENTGQLTGLGQLQFV
jgi:hypothetical protein